MARHSIHEPAVQTLIRDGLVPLFVKAGWTIGGLTAELNTRLDLIGSEERAIWNRVAAVLSGDPKKGINEKTFDLLSKAVAAAPVPKLRAPLAVPATAEWPPKGVEQVMHAVNNGIPRVTAKIISDVRGQLNTGDGETVSLKRNVVEALLAAAEVGS